MLRRRLDTVARAAATHCSACGGHGPLCIVWIDVDGTEERQGLEHCPGCGRPGRQVIFRVVTKRIDE